jgi:hypothetical protein
MGNGPSQAPPLTTSAVWTVKTSSGASAVRVVWSSRRWSREIEHLGSEHDEAAAEARETYALGATVD